MQQNMLGVQCLGQAEMRPREPLYSERLPGSATLGVQPQSKDENRGVCGFPEVWYKHI